MGSLSSPGLDEGHNSEAKDEYEVISSMTLVCLPSDSDISRCRGKGGRESRCATYRDLLDIHTVSKEFVSLKRLGIY